MSENEYDMIVEAQMQDAWNKAGACLEIAHAWLLGELSEEQATSYLSECDIYNHGLLFWAEEVLK